jgi:hypothetical protein
MRPYFLGMMLVFISYRSVGQPVSDLGGVYDDVQFVFVEEVVGLH